MKKCQKAFDRVKAVQDSQQVLAHYDSSLPLSMAANVSAYGVGAVISQQCHDGRECPVAFATRTLTPSECHYSAGERGFSLDIWDQEVPHISI